AGSVGDLGTDGLQLAFGEVAEDLRELLLEYAFDELALLAHFAHAIEELDLDGIAFRALGQVEQGIIDILEQRADEAVDALQGNAPDQLEQFAQAVAGGGHAAGTLLELDHLARFVFRV